MVVMTRDGMQPERDHPAPGEPTDHPVGGNQQAGGGAEPAMMTDRRATFPALTRRPVCRLPGPGGTPAVPFGRPASGQSSRRSIGSRARVNRPAPSIATTGTSTRTPSAGHGTSIGYGSDTGQSAGVLPVHRDQHRSRRCRGRRRCRAPNRDRRSPRPGRAPAAGVPPGPRRPPRGWSARRVPRRRRAPVAIPAAPTVISPAAAASSRSSGETSRGAPPCSTLSASVPNGRRAAVNRACWSSSGGVVVPITQPIGGPAQPELPGGGGGQQQTGLCRSPGGSAYPGRSWTVVGRSGPASTSLTRTVTSPVVQVARVGHHHAAGAQHGRGGGGRRRVHAGEQGERGPVVDSGLHVAAEVVRVAALAAGIGAGLLALRRGELTAGLPGAGPGRREHRRDVAVARCVRPRSSASAPGRPRRPRAGSGPRR